MLEGFRAWPGGAAGAGTEACPAIFGAGAEDRRLSERVLMPGAEVFLFLDGEQRFRFRVRDLGCTGIAGITAAPLKIGQSLIVQLEEMLMPAADVVWTRRASAGLRFADPVPLARFRRLCERHEAGAAWSPAMRAGSDLHAWWTDAQQQKGGRRPRLRAGGHKHPIPR
jgi:hypothetical protein